MIYTALSTIIMNNANILFQKLILVILLLNYIQMKYCSALFMRIYLYVDAVVIGPCLCVRVVRIRMGNI